MEAAACEGAATLSTLRGRGVRGTERAGSSSATGDASTGPCIHLVEPACRLPSVPCEGRSKPSGVEATSWTGPSSMMPPLYKGLRGLYIQLASARFFWHSDPRLRCQERGWIRQRRLLTQSARRTLWGPIGRLADSHGFHADRGRSAIARCDCPVGHIAGKCSNARAHMHACAIAHTNRTRTRGDTLHAVARYYVTETGGCDE